MFPRIFGRSAMAAVVFVGLSLLVELPLRSQESPAPRLETLSPQRALVDRYCVTCHGEKLKTAGLLLDKLDVENPGSGAEAWEKVVRKLRTGAMPPAGAPRPNKADYDFLANYLLQTALDRFAAANPNPGSPAAFHRLNRAETRNVVRDLLALDIEAVDACPSLLPRR